MVFFDDLLIYSPNWEVHLDHVTKTLEILREQQFFIKANKCAFGKQLLKYLGHIISHEGVKVDSKKIDAMVVWPRPANISELRGFLGLIGFYRKFVRNYGILARALTNLSKRETFNGMKMQRKPFIHLKRP